MIMMNIMDRLLYIFSLFEFYKPGKVVESNVQEDKSNFTYNLIESLYYDSLQSEVDIHDIDLKVENKLRSMYIGRQRGTTTELRKFISHINSPDTLVVLVLHRLYNMTGEDRLKCKFDDIFVTTAESKNVKFAGISKIDFFFDSCTRDQVYNFMKNNDVKAEQINTLVSVGEFK